MPIQELPDPEADNGNSGETMREQENKWTDLALNQLAVRAGIDDSLSSGAVAVAQMTAAFVVVRESITLRLLSIYCWI